MQQSSESLDMISPVYMKNSYPVSSTSKEQLIEPEFKKVNKSNMSQQYKSKFERRGVTPIEK